MAIGLFDDDVARRFRDAVNNDGAFRQVSRDMALTLAVQMDGASRAIRVRDGAIQSIGRFVPTTEPVDVTVKGPEDFWTKLLSPVPPPRYQNLYAALRAETCEILGNGELYAAYFAAIVRMIDVLRDVQNA